MKILLIAYEYPPICSAQALRWHYLSAEFVRMGHHVTVVTTDLAIRKGLAPPVAEGVHVVRCFPGPFVGGANRIEQSVGHNQAPSASVAPTSEGFSKWMYRTTRKILDHLVFPDIRSEWFPFANSAVRRLHRGGYRPDFVIGSHEPAVDLQLGIAARRRFKVPFLADLGDPIDTVYSPRWRRRLDRWYEGYILSRADGAVVTLESVRDLLKKRHAVPRGRIEVIPQGFEHGREALSRTTVPFSDDRLNILFTGTLYEAFRNPVAFIKAVAARSDVHLWIAGNLVGDFPAAARSESIRMLGPLKHADVLDAQAGADVLLSVGNRQSEQIPGKIYEYFGAKRPILHLYSAKLDPTRDLVDRYSRGWSVAMTQASCTKILDELVQRRREGALERGLDLASAHEGFSWRARAERLIQFAIIRHNCAR